MTSLDEAEYLQLASRELKELCAALDDLGDDLEAELAGDILTLEFGDGAKYVINSHTAARQIWMAAERQAWHFDYDRESHKWIAKKTKDELWGALERLVAKKLSKSVALRIP